MRRLYLSVNKRVPLPWEGQTLRQMAGRVLRAMLAEEAFPAPAEVSLLITDAEEVRSLNAAYRGINKTTDVLSFPAIVFPAGGDYASIAPFSKEANKTKKEASVFLGDIVLNWERVCSQAQDYGHSIEREFSFLLAHSLLHLLGYDHESAKEAAVMEEKQETVLGKLGLHRAKDT